MSKVVPLLNPKRTITVRYLDQDTMREVTLAAKGHRYETEPELLIVETLNGGFVEWQLDAVLMVTDEPA